MTKLIDEWAANACNVKEAQKYVNKPMFSITPAFVYKDKWHQYRWTIKDPRCREIVREHFKIWTAYGPIGFDRMGWQACTAYNKLTNYHGNTIDEAEIACITAIYEEEK